MITQTKETQGQLTPSSTLQLLKDGNKRFLAKTMQSRDLQEQVKITSSGQAPMAIVLGCVDSRVPLELVFDMGIGDIFGARVAGNIVNEDLLGSMEYACKVAGSKVVLVLGHTKCGAVTSACKGVELGNITALLSKIKPAVNEVIKLGDEVTSEKVEEVVVLNTKMAVDNIRKDSTILAEMEENGEIIILGGVYDVSSGKVNFL